MIVVDRHAFERLWPVLGVWLFLFITAGDAVTIARRYYVLSQGQPAKGELVTTKREFVRMLGMRRKFAYFHFKDARGHTKTAKEPIGDGSMLAQPDIHVLGEQAFLDNDLQYSGFKLLVYGAIFAALWLWALGRYRFG